MKLIVYKPSVDPSWPLAVQLLFDDISRFGRWLLSCLEDSGISFEVVETKEHVVRRINTSTTKPESMFLLCVCFPQQIPTELACQKIAVLPFLFDAYSLNNDYVLPFGDWPKILAEVDGIFVPSKLVESQVINLIESKTRVHVFEPKIPSLALSNFEVRDAEAQDNRRISLSTEMYLSTKDGAWKNLNEPPLDVVERYCSLLFETGTLTWSLGQAGKNGLWPIGFGLSEPWGLWAQITQSSFVLPVSVSGDVSIIVELVGCGANIGREVTVQFGEESKKLQLGQSFEIFVLNFSPDKPVSQIFFSGYLLDRDVDLRGLGVGVATLSISRSTDWSGQKSEWPVSGLDSDSLRPIGFYPSESWGAWAKSSAPVVLLPGFVSGHVRVAIEVVGCGSNIGRRVSIRMGSESHSVVLGEVAEIHLLNFDVAEATNLIYFDGCDLDREVDIRGLGIGLAFVRVALGMTDWSGQKSEWPVSGLDSDSLRPIGFYPSESWGAWAKSSAPVVLLPGFVSGHVRVAIEVVGCGSNIGRRVSIRMGSESHSVVLGEVAEIHLLNFDVAEATNLIYFDGCDLDREVDIRGLGIGLAFVRVSRLRHLGSDRFEWSSSHPEIEDVLPLAFYPSESWGAWAYSDDALLSLPVTVQGRQIVEIELAACGINIGKRITIRMGDDSQNVELPKSRQVIRLKFDVSKPSNTIHINGYELDRTTEARALGIGIGSIRIYRNRHPLEKALQKIAKNRKEILTELSIPVERIEIQNCHPSFKSRIELVGTVFVLVLRPSDLVDEPWAEIIKCFVLGQKSLRNTELVVVLPSDWTTSFLPLMIEMIYRMSPNTATVHFLALNFDSEEFVSLVNYSDSILILRGDGLDFELAKHSVLNLCATVGPLSNGIADTKFGNSTVVAKVLKQPRGIVQGISSPLTMKVYYDNESLSQGLEIAASLEISEKVLAEDHQAKHDLSIGLKSIFRGPLHG